MKVDLYLSGELVDGLDPSEVVALTRQAAKWGNVSQRNADFSNSFKLRKTAKIMQLLDQPDNVASLGPAPYRKRDFELRVNDLPIAYGFAVLNETKEFVELQLFSGLADFFEQLGNVTTADIDISDQNHRWTQANIDNLRDRSADTGGVVYPLINYRRLHQRADKVTGADWLPAIYPARFIDEATAAIGWKVEGYDRTTLIPFAQQEFTAKNVTLGKVSRTSSVSLAPSSPLFRVAVPFNNVITDFYNVFGTQGSLFGVQAHYNGSYTFEIDILVRAQNAGSGLTFYIGDQFLTLLGESKTVVSTTTAQQVTASLTIDYTSTTGNVGLSHISDLTLCISCGPGSGNVIIDAGSTFELVAHEGKTLFNGWVDCNRIVPPIPIKELIMYYARKTCSVVLTDAIARVISFMRLDDIAKRPPVDWSQFVDSSEPERINYRLESYAQRNTFGYLPIPENDPFAIMYDSLTEGVITVDDTTLPESAEAVKAFYVPTYFKQAHQTAGIAANGEQVPTILRYSKTSASYLLPDIDPKFRIGRADLLTDLNAARFIPDYWQNEVAANYNALQAMLNRTKLAEYLLRLPLGEFLAFDPTRPVFLEGQLWYVREIKQYKINETDSTIVSLIRF